MESFLPAFDVMDKCEGESEEAARAACFGEFIQSESEEARSKAIYELSRMSAESAGPILAEAIKTDDLATRELVTFAAYRVPSEELLANLDELIQGQETRSAAEYQRDSARLKMLQAYLKHHSVDPIAAKE